MSTETMEALVTADAATVKEPLPRDVVVIVIPDSPAGLMTPPAPPPLVVPEVTPDEVVPVEVPAPVREPIPVVEVHETRMRWTASEYVLLGLGLALAGLTVVTAVAVWGAVASLVAFVVGVVQVLLGVGPLLVGGLVVFGLWRLSTRVGRAAVGVVAAPVAAVARVARVVGVVKPAAAVVTEARPEPKRGRAHSVELASVQRSIAEDGVALAQESGQSLTHAQRWAAALRDNEGRQIQHTFGSERGVCAVGLALQMDGIDVSDHEFALSELARFRKRHGYSKGFMRKVMEGNDHRGWGFGKIARKVESQG